VYRWSIQGRVPQGEAIALQAIPAGDCHSGLYQGLGKRSAQPAGLVIEKVPTWKHRKVFSPFVCGSTPFYCSATRANSTSLGAGSKISKRKFRQLPLEFVISANLASSVVENPQFRALLEYLDLTVRPFFISRRTLGRDMVTLRQKKQEEVKFVLQRHIQSGGMISMTLDGWTSCSQQEYLAITGHFVEKLSRGHSSDLPSLSLGFRPLSGSLSAENQADVVTGVTEEFEISRHIRSITSDNAAVNEAMCTILEHDERWGNFTVRDCCVACFAHILNLADQEILTVLDVDKEAVNEDDLSRDNTAESDSRADTENEQAAVAAILHIARKIVAKTRKSTHLWEALQTFERVKGLKENKLF
jgi:hypothetical protein